MPQRRQTQEAWEETAPVPVEMLTKWQRAWRRLALRSLAFLARAAWQGVFSQWHAVSLRVKAAECTHSLEFQTNRGNAYAQQTVCDESTGGCGAILTYFPTALALARRSVKTDKHRSKKTVGTLETRAQSISEGEMESNDSSPRCQRGFHQFQTEAQTILR